MSTSKSAAAALAGLLGVGLAPAFIAPGTSSHPASASLRGAAAASASTQAGPSSGTLGSTGVLGSAAVAAIVALKATRKPTVSCQAFDVKQQPGATAPLGFFDPAGFCADGEEKTFNDYRRMELKHGRAAMMATLGLLMTSEGIRVQPGYGFENVPAGLAAQWEEPSRTCLTVIFLLIGCLELGLNQWKEDSAKPGDYGDPLNLGKGAPSLDMQSKELNNGRIAMVAFLGLVSAEVYTGASAPLNYFDPLGLSTTQERFDKFRTSEVKHGRVAMLAILGAIAQHWGHAFGAEQVPAGMAGFADPDGAKGVVAMTCLAGFLELGPWADEFAKEPGNYGDPFGFGIEVKDVKDMKTKELNNGRLAMLATIGAMTAEVVTGDKVTDLPAQLGF